MAHIQDTHGKHKRGKHGTHKTAFTSFKILSVKCALARITCRAKRKRFEEFHLKAKARIRPQVFYLCHVFLLKEKHGTYTGTTCQI